MDRISGNEMGLGHLLGRCAGCERSNLEMTKEHVFPRWLIRRTGTDKTSIRWGNKRIPAIAATFPLCTECNHLFGDKLEAPVSAIFDDLESQRGISESEAELLVRWLWKITGINWIATHPYGSYTRTRTLKERILRPLDEIRGNLMLAISLVKEIEAKYGDRPMGVDSPTEIDAVFASGVFSYVALMVVIEPLADLVPIQFSRFRFLPRRDETCDAKLFYPTRGFDTDTEAVSVTWVSSQVLSVAHDKLAVLREQQLSKRPGFE
jgi:hypothetical protein